MTMTISKMVIKHWLQPEDYNQNVTLWQSGVRFIPSMYAPDAHVYVAVNFLFHLIFIFPLFQIH